MEQKLKDAQAKATIQEKLVETGEHKRCSCARSQLLADAVLLLCDCVAG
jgi:hypothetical protein